MAGENPLPPLVHPPFTRKLYSLRQQGRSFFDFYLTTTGLLMEAATVRERPMGLRLPHPL